MSFAWISSTGFKLTSLILTNALSEFNGFLPLAVKATEVLHFF